MIRKFIYLVAAVVFLQDCAHDKILAPEVSGNGAVMAHGGVVYSLPDDRPVIKMKLVSMSAASSTNLEIV